MVKMTKVVFWVYLNVEGSSKGGDTLNQTDRGKIVLTGMPTADLSGGVSSV
jgi:hypothetical protein